MVVERLKGKRHLRVSGGGVADVVFKGVEIVGGVQGSREKVVRFEDDLVLVVIGICNDDVQGTRRSAGKRPNRAQSGRYRAL